MSQIFDKELQERQPLACSIFTSAIERGKLAHAYLLTGRADEDKLRLATELAAFLNCTSELKLQSGSCSVQAADGFPANICSNCKWISDHAHPQAWLVLSGEETKTGRISVEKARLLADELSKTSQYVRIVVVPSANQDSFHRPAANALLKTIEEPGPRCLFLFFAEQEEQVLSTIVSRCQLVPLRRSSDLGMWVPQTRTADLSELRRQLHTSTTGRDFSNVASATHTLATTLEWSSHLQDLSEQDGYDELLIIDMVVSGELDTLRDSAADDPALSLYLNRLLHLAESTKDQIEHFVQVKSALESFALSCRELRQGPSQETLVESH